MLYLRCKLHALPISFTLKMAQPLPPCKIFSMVTLSVFAGNQTVDIFSKSGSWEMVYVKGMSHFRSLVEVEFKKNRSCVMTASTPLSATFITGKPGCSVQVVMTSWKVLSFGRSLAYGERWSKRSLGVAVEKALELMVGKKPGFNLVFWCTQWRLLGKESSSSPLRHD